MKDGEYRVAGCFPRNPKRGGVVSDGGKLAITRGHGALLALDGYSLRLLTGAVFLKRQLGREAAFARARRACK